MKLLILSLLLAGCTANTAGLAQPISRAQERATPLSFGLYITPSPDTNPIRPPERFTGYHVGTDYEVTADELDAEIPVFAICSGSVASAGYTDGYGGLLTERCSIGGQDVTVLYGHLAVASLPLRGTRVAAGQQIGILGAARSTDTDGNRKHLHLGIHLGTDHDVRGYVQNESEIAEFLDIQQFLPSLQKTMPGSTLLEPYWAVENQALESSVTRSS